MYLSTKYSCPALIRSDIAHRVRIDFQHPELETVETILIGDFNTNIDRCNNNNVLTRKTKGI